MAKFRSGSSNDSIGVGKVDETGRRQCSGDGQRVREDRGLGSKKGRKREIRIQNERTDA